MNELAVTDIVKEFRLSRRQMRSQSASSPLKVAVNHVSFSLNAGEIYGLLGPNGAGKTTTLRIIASLLTPKSGAVLYHGEDIQKNLPAYRKALGFLTSELKLDDFFTPDYTFTYMSRLYGMKEEEIEKRKKELFARFGIDKFAFVRIKELSTGMKQKVSLAISLCHDPDIILFDEPTNGLDIIASKEVEDFLLDLKKAGKVVLISTHIFSLVEKLCDRVGIIVEGELIADEGIESFKGGKSLEERFFEVTEGRIPS